SCFFFQAEDGIRDRNVTGVQTCALPIFRERTHGRGPLTESSTKTHGPESDAGARFPGRATFGHKRPSAADHAVLAGLLGDRGGQIGRASCRERRESTYGDHA